MAGVGLRRRPRIRSVNFRRLRYVLVREAALRILAPSPASFRHEVMLRSQLCRRQLGNVLTVAGMVLALHPERRTWPGLPL